MWDCYTCFKYKQFKKSKQFYTAKEQLWGSFGQAGKSILELKYIFGVFY